MDQERIDIYNRQLRDLLRQGDVEGFNKLRAYQPSLPIDFNGFDAKKVDLDGINLSGIDMRGVVQLNKVRCMSYETQLTGTLFNPAQISWLMKMKSAFNHYREENDNSPIDMTGVSLAGVDCDELNIEGLDLRVAKDFEKAKNFRDTSVDGTIITPEQYETLSAEDQEVCKKFGLIVKPLEVTPPSVTENIVSQGIVVQQATQLDAP